MDMDAPVRPGWQPTLNAIWIMQSVGIALQIVNAGIATATHSAVWALVAAALVGGYQSYAQHLGNQNQNQNSSPSGVGKARGEQ
jgi:hypothetical protein